ncbi:DEAD/DEAH box helicase [Galactobacter caseinivorans]|uniref:RNA helicase n=1 Tax=Galactobacter caseinivorans TaxID=2676123 RepID=A0A496PM56_9MICC|nr:ATP-dependent helicase [Galactobacter caseinivorans]
MTENNATSTDVQQDQAENIPVEAIVAETAVVEVAAPVQQSFAEFGVSQEIIDALAEKGITYAFPIQAMTLTVALGGHDIIGQAKTGTGKTLGFGIPALQRVVGPGEDGFEKLTKPGAPQALIVAPTRELAVQVAEDLTVAASKRPVRIATIYGGRAYEPQIDQLNKGVELVVGTPGRLIDLMRQRHLDLKHVRIVVLDEADEMLDLGFLPDVETLLSAVPEVRQTMLFSATMPGPVVAMARRFMSQPTHIRAADPDDDSITKKDIRQVIYRAHHLDKDEIIARVLQSEGRGRSIIFTRTKRQAARLSEELTDRGFAAGALHGDLGQGAREQALRAFRNGKVDVLVATDVAARGIDVDDVTHVINLQCPDDEKTYLHRVGRTGRAGNKGTAITFVDWEDVPRWGLINKALGLDQAEPVETYSSSPHLFTDLFIPKGTKGRLPRDKRVLEGLSGEQLEDLGETGKSGPRDGGRDGGRGGRDGGRGGERGGRDGQRDGGRGGSRGGRGRGASSSDGGGERRERTPRAPRDEQSTNAGSADAPAEGSERRERGKGRADRPAHESGTPKTEGGAPRRRRRRTRHNGGSEGGSAE